MKYLNIIIGLFLLCNISAQVDMNYVIGSDYTTIITFETEIGAKLIQKRFDYAAINKDIEVIDCKIKIFRFDCQYFIEYEENDENEYFKFLGLKIYCLPRKIRKSLPIDEFGYIEIWKKKIITFENVQL